MTTIRVEVPAELLALAQGDDTQPSRVATKLIVLELFREHRISLGKAAELASMAQEEFLAFSAQHEVPLHYALPDWENDHAAAKDLAR